MTVKTNKVITPTLKIGTSDTDSADVGQLIQSGANDKPAYVVTSTASQSGVDCGDSDLLSFTDGSGNDKPFTLLFAGKVETIGSVYEALISKWDNSSSNKEYAFQRLPTTGLIQLRVTNATASAYIDAAGPVVSNGWHTFVASYDGSKVNTGIKVYYDGVLQALTYGGTGSYTGMTNGAAKLIVGGLQNVYTVPWPRGMNRAIVFNYVLSDEKIRRYSAGAKLDYEDIGGNNTNLASGWNLTVGWSTFQSSVNDLNTFTAGAFSAGHVRYPYMMNIGKKYEIKIVATCTAGQTLQLYEGLENTLIASGVGGISGTYYVTTSITGTYQGMVCIRAFGSGTVVDITTLEVRQVGAVLDLEPEDISANQWTDQSGNELHGTPYLCSAINLPKYVNTEFGPAGTKADVLSAAATPSHSFNGSNLITASSITGTTPFTVLSTFRTDYASGSDNIAAMWAGNWLIGIDNGVLRAYNTLAETMPFSGTYHDGRWHTVTVTQDTALARTRGWVDGVLNTQRNSSYSPTFSSAIYYIGGNSGGSSFKGQVSRSVFFNYVLSDEKIRRYSAGAKLDFDDIGGSMVTMVNNGGLSSGDTGWLKSGVTIADQGGGDYEIVASSAADGSGVWQYNFANGSNILARDISPGKRFRITYTITSISAGGFVCKLNVGASTTTGTTRTSVGTYSEELVAPNVSGIGSLSINCVGTTTGRVDDISMVQLGALIDFEPEGIGQGPGWLDSSGNNLHGATTNCQAINLPYVDRPNFLINGGFHFWQRGTSFTTGSGTYTADRWLLSDAATGAASRITESTSSSGYALRLTGVQNAYTSINQRIEAAEVRRLGMLSSMDGSGLVTISGWLKKSANPTNMDLLYIRRFYPSAMDNWGSFNTESNPLVDLLANIGTSWTFFSYTFALSANDLAYGLMIQILMHSANSASVPSLDIKDLVLSPGAHVPKFSLAGGNIAGELALCQRYYWRYVPKLAGSRYGVGYCISTTNVEAVVANPVTMRSTVASLETTGTATDYSVNTSAGATVCSSVPTILASNEVSNALQFVVASGLTAGQGAHIRAVNTSAYLGFSAEL